DKVSLAPVASGREDYVIGGAAVWTIRAGRRRKPQPAELLYRRSSAGDNRSRPYVGSSVRLDTAYDVSILRAEQKGGDRWRASVRTWTRYARSLRAREAAKSVSRWAIRGST